MIVVTDEMEKTMNHDTVEFVSEIGLVKDRILSDRIYTYEKIPGKPVALAIIESYDISEVIMLNISHVDVEDVIVRTKDDGYVSYPADLTPGNHSQPTVIQVLALENEVGIFVVI